MAVEFLGTGNDDGSSFGRGSDLLTFWSGATPTSRRASATMSSDISLFALTGASFVANTSTTVSGLFGFNSTLASQLVDWIKEIRTVLVDLNMHKGSA